MRQTTFVLLVSQTLVAATASRAAGALFYESADAGHLPELAQDVAIVGSVEAIVGRIENAFDADLFRLVIDVPTAFSASVTLSDDFAVDPQLFLFDQWGRGVVANDNRFGARFPMIPLGSMSGETPGTYLLAVSAADCDPEGIFGEIFPDVSSGLVRPAGVAQFAPLINWSRDFSATGGNYSIVLTGVLGLLEPPLGDYSGNGIVDAADYVVWRDNLSGSDIPSANPSADGDRDGDVDQHDYAVWTENFGSTAGSGAGVVAVSSSRGGAVPEPATLGIVTTLCLCAAAYHACSSRHFSNRSANGS